MKETKFEIYIYIYTQWNLKTKESDYLPQKENWSNVAYDFDWLSK